jgi:hypothetical protein
MLVLLKRKEEKQQFALNNIFQNMEDFKYKKSIFKKIRAYLIKR